jgi:hypothetical protein
VSSVLRFDEWQDSNGVPVASGAGGKFVAPGKILQVVQTFKNDVFSASVATGVVVDITGLSVSITPTSTSSKIMVFVDVSIGQNSSGDNGNAILLTRNGTKVGFGVEEGSRTGVLAGTRAQATEDIATASGSFLDSPSSTSSLTYQVRIMHNRFDTQTVFVNRSRVDDNLDRRFRSGSSITLMEVAG